MESWVIDGIRVVELEVEKLYTQILNINILVNCDVPIKIELIFKLVIGIELIIWFPEPIRGWS